MLIVTNTAAKRLQAAAGDPALLETYETLLLYLGENSNAGYTLGELGLSPDPDAQRVSEAVAASASKLPPGFNPMKCRVIWGALPSPPKPVGPRRLAALIHFRDAHDQRDPIKGVNYVLVVGQVSRRGGFTH